MARQQQPHQGPKPTTTPNERNSLGRPQLFVQLTFGVSWSDRHVPRTHTLSYTSKHLKNARNSGHFPRQPSYPQQRRPDPSQRQHRGDRQHHRDHREHREHRDHRDHRDHHREHREHREHRDHERPRGRPSHPRAQHSALLSPPRQPRSDERRGNFERGSSAPPVVQDGPWNGDESGPSATLFPRPARTITNPARFRLGADGLPWSASAWPFDEDEDEDEEDDDDDDDELPFANCPTTLPLSPLSRRGSIDSEDPLRVRELESLSTAMVTVDNGFENQWWNQGAKASTPWFPPGHTEDDIRPMSTADAVLLSAAEPPSGVDTYSPDADGFHDLISPLSDFGPSIDFSSPLQRSNSTRSDELWMDR
ncbi:hypothetical protein F4777DRAFT_579159 [Nemania sp. FL0916]|nr:hypothetical protein F4777DRAFT_579159 [Nemania sp. FL0916]